MIICHQCEEPIIGDDVKCHKNSLSDLLFHKSKNCFDKFCIIRDSFLRDLDKPLNNCIFFRRTDGQLGNYERDGKTFEGLDGRWKEQDIWGQSLFRPKNLTEEKRGAFLSFLKKNGWLNREVWFIPRKRHEDLLNT